MEHALLKPIRSELHYRGVYGDNAFELLGAPVPLYRSLVTHLGPFGVTLQNLKFESSGLADSHVSCGLPELNVGIRVRVDRVEIDFWRLHEIGADSADRIVLATWTAVREASDSVGIASHFVDLIMIAEILGGNCSALMNRYVMPPEQLGVVDTGVAFYSRPVEKDQQWVDVVLDRVFGQDSQLFVKVTMGFSAAEVAIDALALHVGTITNTTLDRVGLQLGTDGPK